MTSRHCRDRQVSVLAKDADPPPLTFGAHLNQVPIASTGEEMDFASPQGQTASRKGPPSPVPAQQKNLPPHRSRLLGINKEEEFNFCSALYIVGFLHVNRSQSIQQPPSGAAKAQVRSPINDPFTGLCLFCFKCPLDNCNCHTMTIIAQISLAASNVHTFCMANTGKIQCDF